MDLDTQPLKQPRRIVFALFIFAFLAGSTGGIVGLATASDEAPDDAGPVTIPEPQIGDRGTYRLRAVDLPEPGAPTDGLPVVDEATSGALSFEFQAPQSIVLPDGSPRNTIVVALDDQTPETEGHFNWEWPVTYGVHVDASSMETVAFLNEWTEEEKDETDDGTTTEYSESQEMHFDGPNRGRDAIPVCGLISDIQGRTVRADDQGGPLAMCRGGHGDRDAKGGWKVLGTVQEDERRYAVVVSTGLGLNVRMWYEEGLPVPSRVEATPRSGWGGGGTLVAELTGFSAGRGGNAYAMPAKEAPVSIDVAPSTDAMFDDTGIDHPFPASEAHDVALSMAESGLADFLAEHPDAYIVDGSYWQFHQIRDGTEYFDYEWRFDYADAKAAWEVWIGKTTKPPAPTDAATQEPGSILDDLLDPDPDPEPAPSQADPEYYLFGSGPIDNERYTPWFPKPAELPTVASMWAYYDALKHDEAAGLEANYWEWAILDAWGGIRIIIQAGRWQDTPYPDGGDFTYHREWAFAEWEFQDSHEPYRFSQRFHVTSLPDQAPPGMVAQASAGHVDIVGWRLPAGAAAAIGFGAGLLALFYYLWPVLKSGAFGAFFSRVQADTALENPRRARVFDVVKTNPGIHFQDVVRASGLAEGNTSHHLRKLEHVGLVTHKKTRGYTSYFERGTVDRNVMTALANIRSPAARDLLRTIAKRPGITNKELGETAGLSKSTVSYHMKKLRDAGLADEGNRPTDLALRAATAA